MQTLSANEAKTQFGDMLMKAQREPVQINKNGKPVAVLVSIESFEESETMKLHFLQDRAEKCKEHIKNGTTVDGEAFFDELEAGMYD
ncbi:MAG: prevent-host-death family protein [Phenylobacterium sp.]|jgi:prevent-host-death family protein